MSTKKAVPSVKTPDTAASTVSSKLSPATPKKAKDMFLQFGYVVSDKREIGLGDFEEVGNLGNGTIKLPPRGPGPAPSREFVEIFEIDVPESGVVIEVGIRFRPR
ncbi:hypothetical protein [Nevskia sp.]|uniref:hypothetical protein n=1 Tax=Nevskia sp. TaxID=1929292 RepID=UPI0025E735F3|nr:hypothetical protein [Nevskia sp.]